MLILVRIRTVVQLEPYEAHRTVLSVDADLALSEVGHSVVGVLDFALQQAPQAVRDERWCGVPSDFRTPDWPAAGDLSQPFTTWKPAHWHLWLLSCAVGVITHDAILWKPRCSRTRQVGKALSAGRLDAPDDDGRVGRNLSYGVP